MGLYPANYLIGREPLLVRPEGLSPAALWPPDVCGISPSFPGLFPIPGQVTHVLLSRLPLFSGPKPRESFDLHALSAPPAFVLSQDQTRRRFALKSLSTREKYIRMLLRLRAFFLSTLLLLRSALRLTDHLSDSAYCSRMWGSVKRLRLALTDGGKGWMRPIWSHLI